MDHVLTGVSGIVLAGGRGSRLGGVDKAGLEIGGTTTLDRVRAALDPLVEETILVVNDDRPDTEPGTRVVRDPEPHGGVLPALAAALEAASRPLGVVVACDMPFVDSRVLELLLARASGSDLVIPVVGGRPEPMHAVYRRAPCLEAVRASLARGDRRMIAFHEAVRVRRVEERELRAIDPELRSFFNVNTPEDLAEARLIAASR